MNRFYLSTLFLALLLVGFPSHNASAVVCPSGGTWPYQCLANNQPLCSSVMPANAHLTGAGEAPGIGRCALSYDVTCNECGVAFNRNCNACTSYSGWACNDGYTASGFSCVPSCVVGACTSTANACGQTNGTRSCPSGTCTPPANPVGYGNACSSAPNTCGQTGAGTIQCNGTCNGVTPANPANLGNACQSIANLCGIKGDGTIQCNGACSATVPLNSACGAPTCSVSPASPKVGQNITVTGSGVVFPYSFTTGGSVVAMTGSSVIVTYATQGTKNITVYDSNIPAKTGTCSTTVCVTTVGNACTSGAVNACGLPDTGTIACDGTCSVVPQPLSSCPAPTCSVVATGSTGQPITATAIGSFPTYSWTTTGGNPPNLTAGATFTTTYSTTGPKSILITDSNPSGVKAGSCSVTIGNANMTTGQVSTSQNNPKPIAYDTRYTVRLTVWDSLTPTKQFGIATRTDDTTKTMKGPWPKPTKPTMSPEKPAAKQDVTFTFTPAERECSDGCEYSWLFSSGQTVYTNPAIVQFAAEQQDIQITLGVRNDFMPVGEYCSEDFPAAFSVQKAIPGYREVLPGSRPSPSPTTQRNNTGGSLNPSQ